MISPQELYLRRQGVHIVSDADRDQKCRSHHDADHLIGEADGRDHGDHEAGVNGQSPQTRYQSMMHLARIRLVDGADADGEVLHHRRQHEGHSQCHKKRERIGEQRNTS